MIRQRLQQTYDFVDAWLPKPTWLRAPIIMITAAAPLLLALLLAGAQIEGPSIGLLAAMCVAVTVSVCAVLYVIVEALLVADAAAFALMAKRVGQQYEPSSKLKKLETHPLWCPAARNMDPRSASNPDPSIA